MKVIKFSQLSWCIAGAAMTLSTCLSAAPLNLASKPLVVADGAPPNIMILFDTSGSMGHIAASSNYPQDATDPNYANWNSCSGSTRTIPSGTTIALRIVAGGYPAIRYNNGSTTRNYFWGASSPNNITHNGTTLQRRCFDPAGIYQAHLRTDTGGIGNEATYTGHYLNYYFGSVLDGSWSGTYHPLESPRLDIGKNVISNFVDGQPDDSINLGISRFNSEYGANVTENVEILSAAKKLAIKSDVNSYNNSGYTPLSESLMQLGRYFVGGYSGSLNYTQHPSGTNASANATSIFNASPSNGTGTSLTSPIDTTAFCEKNYIIAMTDGQPTRDQSVSSYLRDYDGDCQGTPDPTCSSYDRKNVIDSNGTVTNYGTYPTDGSDYMDDVALAMREIDLRPDVDDNLGNEYPNFVETFLIGFGDYGVKSNQLFKDTARNGSYDPISGNSTYTEPFLPDTAADLDRVFAEILANIRKQEGSVASVSFNSGQLDANSAVYQAKFKTQPWAGSLLAFNLDDNNGSIQTPEAWDAAVVLDAMANPHTSRNVLTYDPAAATPDGVVLSVANWANVPQVIKDDLYQGPDVDSDGTPNDDDDAQALLNYLLGDNTNETTFYRTRELADDGDPTTPIVYNRLGDIVNSTPVFVGEPQMNWPEYSDNPLFGSATRSYSTFKTSSASVNRTPIIYVGANDGMLHGFNADLTSANGGREEIAYVPSMIASTNAGEGLHYLADPGYQHNFYVDLTPTISDVFVGSDWRTVLIGGLRAGGRGLFALDVTNPSWFSSAARADDIVMWEFDNSVDADLGYTYGQPTITMIKTGSTSGKWVAIVGNGYNSTGSGTAQLFIITIDGGLDGSWSATDYYKIDTGVGNTTTPNGLSTPRAVDLDGDQVVDRVYAGDLYGNMWAFDLSGGAPSSWVVANGGNPVFTQANEPITAAPILARNTNVTTNASNEPNLLVLFGTGQFIESGDANNTAPMSFYGVWDSNSGTTVTKSNLAQRSLVSSSGLRKITGSPIDWSVDQGWYMALPDTGERVVSDPAVRRKVLFFNTIVPDSQICTAGGYGWLMSVDFTTGLAPPFGVFDANNDGVIDDADIGAAGQIYNDGLPAKSGFLGTKQYTPGVKGNIQEREVYTGTGPFEGRLTWQEFYRN